MSGHDLHLPPEILTQILTKLPVKSLVRFRCGCKTWYSLISCPNFKTLNHSTGDRLLIHRVDTKNRVGNFTFHDKSFVESHEHHHVPEPLRSPYVDIVGSCDGLICLSEYRHRASDSVHSCLIWNPSIRKLVKLPLLYSPSMSGISYLFGFGFDPESRYYKVVRVACPKTYGPTGSDVVAVEPDIFDLRKGVWRSSSSPMRPFYFRGASLHLCGNLHWIVNDGTHTNYVTKHIILSFNLSGEVFQEMGMAPGGAEDDNGDYFSSDTELFTINELLSVAMVKEMQRGDAFQNCCSVWSMKEYGVTESWTKLFNIELPYVRDFLNLFRFWENGELLFVDHFVYDLDIIYVNDVLALYNPESKKSTTLLSTHECLDACFYKESLILL